MSTTQYVCARRGCERAAPGGHAFCCSACRMECWHLPVCDQRQRAADLLARHATTINPPAAP